LIDAPPTTPPKHGLITAATVHPHQATDPQGRWEIGFGFLPENCSDPETWVIPCVGPAGTEGPGAAATPGSEPGYPDDFLNFTPYQLQAEFECDTQSRQAIDFADRAERILEAGTGKAMEYELWEGRTAGVEALAADGNLQLTDSNTFTDSGPITTAITTPRLGLISLIQAAARSTSGQRSMIHATAATVAAWHMTGALKEEGARLVTVVGGHVVVAGSGYTGSGPDNTPDADDDVHWAYITSPVQYLLGEVRVNPPGGEIRGTDPDAQAFDFRENDEAYIAHRTAVAFWDGCLHTGLPINTMGDLT
jgi:hypothetical protein